MRLSEAIFRGSLITEPLMGALLIKDGRRGVKKACAIGAAVLIVDPVGLSQTNLQQCFPYLMDYVSFPSDNRYANRCIQTLGTIIVRLNDYYNWSRERIAEWVASEEDKHPEWFATIEPQVKIEVDAPVKDEELVAVP
jgi:hypothetical protein